MGTTLQLQEFLQAIKPGLTLYGVLVTLALISFAIGRFFWKYEKELQNDNISFLRDLMGGFRRSYIEPFLEEQLTTTRKDAYEIVINGLVGELYTTSSGGRRELVEDDKLKNLVDESNLKNIIKGLTKDDEVVGKFLSSSYGDEFFDKLDHKYEARSLFLQQYYSVCKYCMRTAYAFLFLAIILLIGILRVLIKWPDIFLFFWILISLQAFAYGIYSFVRLEKFRCDLHRRWEELQFYGKI